MLRLFVGLALPEDLRQRLALLAGGLPGARWTPLENFHLTLRFIGEVDEVDADAVDRSLRTIQLPAFTLRVSGLGTFDRAKGRYQLWAGVRRDEALVHLQEKIESAVVRAGLPAEKRRFLPHISLARLKDTPLGRLQAFIAGDNLFQAEILVTSFSLFSSHLGRHDPIYRIERDYPLEPFRTTL
ncbi:RNA 2',3'-cyclic phosphodiesterase [Telmatospirillum sp.]|uniref:RNA 2',3'-cyclic phosphodiesterase n=1 Tax=Telmatospirillum sp. TaxID=2079197 RepID=UPI00284D20C2|nr:RNA 2',3'-cyclic phosphodiesterase [Telmatospirillum sp.]MDR3440453.1 RNA 2',3'-cyclic phosphodiesterase [Telmatospirillum sp.]